MSVNINADTTNGLVMTSDTSGELKLQSAGADIASVTANGIDVTGEFAVDTNTLYVDATNNRVGIGTSSPATKLDITTSGGGKFQVTDWGSSSQIGTDTTGQALRINGVDSVRFHTGTAGSQTERMRIDSSGNIGINTTSPRAKVDVKTGDLIVRSASESTDSTIYLGTPFNDTAALKTAIIAEGIGSYSRAKLHFCLDNNTSNDVAYNGSISNAIMTIEADGNVKITQPAGKYTVDVTGGATSIANTGTVDFPSASGMLVVNNHYNGQVTIFLCGGGSTNVIGTVGGTVGTFSYNPGVAGYRWTNNTGVTATFGFFFVRTRQTA